MTTKDILEAETYSDEDWLSDFNSDMTKTCAKTSIRVFNQFCQHQTGLNGKSKENVISKYQTWIRQTPPDIRSVCLNLNKFIKFMQENHKDIEVFRNDKIGLVQTFKAKKPKTIKSYFGFVKANLRVCHQVKITVEDVKDYIKFPKQEKHQKHAVTLQELKQLFGLCEPKKRALYYVLVSSGMRIGEALSLKKSNFHLDEKPIRISLLAKDTKTKEARETYISAEAYERLKPILDQRKDNEYIFHDHKRVYHAVINECRYFMNLRNRLGLDEKYPDSIRALISIHSFRAYFHTKASQKHGSDYANALDGHGSYLKVYYREDPKERAVKYLELEPSLLIESVKVEADKTKDKIIDTLQEQMVKMQIENERIMFALSLKSES